MTRYHDVIPCRVIPVRIERDGAFSSVYLHTLTDEELARFASTRPDPLEGWRWARSLAKSLAGADTSFGTD